MLLNVNGEDLVDCSVVLKQALGMKRALLKSKCSDSAWMSLQTRNSANAESVETGRERCFRYLYPGHLNEISRFLQSPYLSEQVGLCI